MLRHACVCDFPINTLIFAFLFYPRDSTRERGVAVLEYNAGLAWYLVSGHRQSSSLLFRWGTLPVHLSVHQCIALCQLSDQLGLSKTRISSNLAKMRCLIQGCALTFARVGAELGIGPYRPSDVHRSGFPGLSRDSQSPTITHQSIMTNNFNWRPTRSIADFLLFCSRLNAFVTQMLHQPSCHSAHGKWHTKVTQSFLNVLGIYSSSTWTLTISFLTVGLQYPISFFEDKAVDT